MGAQSLLGELQGALGVLERASLEELDDSLFVGGDSSDLGNDLADEFDSLPEGAFAAGRADLLTGLLRNFEFGDCVSLVLSDGDHSWVRFSHN